MVAELLEFEIETHPGDIVNITDQVNNCVQKTKIKNGLVNVSMSGSTGAISTTEYEPGLIKTDIPVLLQKLIPEGPEIEYAHHRTWDDHNGAGHLRSFLLKPTLTVPVVDGRLLLGTWQQIVYIECDERSRDRIIYCQFVG
jgi:secondary thiamine-phosphate synthase enzyme